MALTDNYIVIDPDTFSTITLAGGFFFDDILGALQPKAQQLEVILRPGVDGESLRETGVRAIPSPIRTLHAFLDRGDALTALEQYLTLIDGNPYEIVQHDESYGFFRVLAIQNQQLLPIATGAGWLVDNPTVLQILDWVVLGTEPPPEP